MTETPGPGSYEINHEKIQKKTPKWVFNSAKYRQKLKTENTPSPMEYTVNNNYNSQFQVTGATVFGSSKKLDRK